MVVHVLLHVTAIYYIQTAVRNKTRQSQLRFHYFTSTRFGFP